MSCHDKELGMREREIHRLCPALYIRWQTEYFTFWWRLPRLLPTARHPARLLQFYSRPEAASHRNISPCLNQFLSHHYTQISSWFLFISAFRTWIYSYLRSALFCLKFFVAILDLNFILIETFIFVDFRSTWQVFLRIIQMTFYLRYSLWDKWDIPGLSCQGCAEHSANLPAARLRNILTALVWLAKFCPAPIRQQQARQYQAQYQNQTKH